MQKYQHTTILKNVLQYCKYLNTLGLIVADEVLSNSLCVSVCVSGWQVAAVVFVVGLL